MKYLQHELENRINVYFIIILVFSIIYGFPYHDTLLVVGLRLDVVHFWIRFQNINI